MGNNFGISPIVKVQSQDSIHVQQCLGRKRASLCETTEAGSTCGLPAKGFATGPKWVCMKHYKMQHFLAFTESSQQA